MATQSPTPEQVHSNMSARRDELGAALEPAGLIAGVMAHEFNNVLTMIGANLELARPGIAGEARDALDRAADAVRLGAIALRKYQVLAEAPDAARPGARVLADEIGRAVELLSRTSGCAIDLAMEANLWPVRIPAGDIETALVALARNALDATPCEAARVSIVARNVRDSEGPNALGDAVRIDVQDEGVGMSPEVLARATEARFTTRSCGRSAGLGLTVVLSLVELVGGRVDIRSEAGRGTTVSLLLPRAAENATASEVAGQVPLGDGELVLILARDGKAGERMAALAEGLGYAAAVARDESDAVRTLAEGARPAVLLQVSDEDAPYDASAAAIPEQSATGAVIIRLARAVSRPELATALSDAIGRSGSPRGDGPRR
jgi:hypothetical protein